MKAKILWVSRHTPLRAQIEYLRDRLGDVDVKVFSKRVPSAEWLLENVVKPGGYGYIIPVLPMSIIARLVELSKRHGFALLWADMELLHNDYSEECAEYDPDRDAMVPGIDSRGRRMWRHYRFNGFKKIKDVRIEFEEF